MIDARERRTADMTREVVREVLTLASERIADESNWCQDALARDDEGREVQPLAESATQWCAFGALIVELDARDDLDGMVVKLAYERAAGCNIATLNDSDGHGAVMAAYERAIEAASQAV